jgi:hypothetical protein
MTHYGIFKIHILPHGILGIYHIDHFSDSKQLTSAIHSNDS